MRFSERSVLEWALVSVEIFNYPRSLLLRWLGDSMGMDSFSEDSIKKIEKARDQFEKKKEAAFVLFEEDLNFIIEAMRSFDLVFTESHLSKNLEIAFDYFSLKSPNPVSPLPLILVDEFPSPFEDHAKITNLISFPYEMNGNRAGIYVKKDALSPFLPIQLMEEAMKISFRMASSRIPENNLPHRNFSLPWFEEGASLWMAMEAFYETFGDTLMLKRYKNRLLMYNELSSSRVLQSFSIICNAFKTGRLDSSVKNYLSNPKAVDWSDLLNVADFIPSEASKEIETFLLQFPNSPPIQYLLPVEYLLLKRIGDGMSVEELSRTTELPPEILKKTLELLSFLR